MFIKVTYIDGTSEEHESVMDAQDSVLNKGIRVEQVETDPPTPLSYWLCGT